MVNMGLLISSSSVDIPGHQLLTPAIVASIGSLVVVVLLTLLRWAALPKPIPGIPYNTTSASRVTGDNAEMRKAGRMRVWMRDQFAIHKSPIVQVFLAPFGKPWLLVSDFREAHDVMTRRTREFDRSSLTTDSFGGVMPASHINMKTADHRFRQNKELVKDLMTPAFLNEVSAPEIYEKMISLLQFWTIKTRYGNGRPFAAGLDIFMAALDITMAVVFDFPQSNTMLEKQVADLKSHSQTDTTGPQDKPFPFSSLPLDPELEACIYLINSIGVAFQSPLPSVTNWLYLQKPSSRRALRLKKELIRQNIDRGLKRLEKQKTEKTEKKLRCAVDQILLREMEAARKHQFQPNFHRNAIYDELFGFIVGGHDTTSTTLAWSVKYMARFQREQSHMRKTLHAAHAAAFSEGRLPTVGEITRTQIPYLEAMTEETLRYGHIVPIVLREAIVNTQILGFSIPKGTQIFFLSNGASYLQPAFEIDEGKRTESARDARSRHGVWDAVDIGAFAPERWLQTDKSEDEDGRTVERDIFDPQAGPNLPFGAGARACFGRRLAYLEMRIALTLLIWSFEFLEMGEELNNFAVIDRATEMPRDCYVKLRKLEY